MPSSVIFAARKAGIHVTITDSLEEVLADTDVLYVTRVQKERFASEAQWEQVKDAYRVDHALLSRAKEDMIVMHPLPRVNGESFVRRQARRLLTDRAQRSIPRSTSTRGGLSTSDRCAMDYL
jgi:aspartate carbamoyltransferase catalytic subunit